MLARTTALIHALLMLTASAKQYAFDFSNGDMVPSMLEAGSPLFTRMLQGNSEPCIYEGANLVCSYAFELGNITNPTQVQFVARCDIDSQVGFDYRRASGCVCQAQVSNPESGAVKVCPCTICQVGFGETPIHVDCGGNDEETDEGTPTTASENSTSTAVAVESAEEDGVVDSVAIPSNRRSLQDSGGSPFLYSTCTSVDCGGACNGTCALNCDESGASCPFCENFEGNQPTGAPTGAGEGGIKNFGESGAAAAAARGLVGRVIVVVAAIVALAV